ncbi:MAG: hypothetical protein FJ148_28800 [Deltaproteobacteria bacterium]|nr:hypothetical protein [Deltaproteobacteria bacterium]
MTVLAEEKKSCGEGTSPADTLNFLVANDAPSLALIPYYPVCSYPPGSEECLDAVDVAQDCANDPQLCTDLAIGSRNGVAKQPHAQVLDDVKTWIAAGNVVQMTIVVPIEFGK